MRSALLLLSLAAFASVASMRVTDPMLPRLASEFGIGIASAASVVTGFTLAYGVMQVFYGPLGDRFGKLHVIAWGCAAAAAASLACWLAPEFPALVIARVIAGAFCASVIPLAMAWIGDVVAYEERQPVLARFLLGQIFGLAGGATVGGFAAEQAHWRWPFLALGVCFAFTALLLLRVARDTPHPRATPRERDVRGAVFRSPWARIVVTTVFIEGVLVFGVIAFVPTHLHFAGGIALSEAGLSLVAYAIGGGVFALLARPLVRHLGEKGLASAGTLLLTIGLAIIALAPAPLSATTGCFVAGLGFYALHNTLQTNATQMAPSRRGAAMALFASLFFFGQSVGVAAAGLMVERYGTTGVILGAGVAMIPLGITFAWLLRFRAALQPAA